MIRPKSDCFCTLWFLATGSPIYHVQYRLWWQVLLWISQLSFTAAQLLVTVRKMVLMTLPHDMVSVKLYTCVHTHRVYVLTLCLPVGDLFCWAGFCISFRVGSDPAYLLHILKAFGSLLSPHLSLQWKRWKSELAYLPHGVSSFCRWLMTLSCFTVDSVWYDWILNS